MSKDVTFDQARRLCVIGFNRLVNKSYNVSTGEITSHIHVNANALDGTYYSAPTVSEALDFIREEKHIPCYVDAGYCHQYDTVGYWGVILSDFGYIKRVQTETSPTHPLASSALLDAVLTYLEQKEKKP